MKRLPVTLCVDTLVLARGGRVVVDRLSFKVARGAALIVKGPNGAGKTTLLRALAGFLAPQSGSIALDGCDRERSVGEHCHYVGHLNGIKSSLTVVENLAFWADYLGTGQGRAERVDSALNAFDLEPLADIPAGYLSAGQKRRLGLARLVVADRALWLLDEPTVSLDRNATTLLAAAVDRHTAQGGMVVAATHLDLGLQRTADLWLGSRSEAA